MIAQSFFAELMARGGPFMPLILLTGFVGSVLALERLMLWAVWWYQDRPLMRALDPGVLARRVRQRADRASPSPLLAVLREADTLTGLVPERREARVSAAVQAQLPAVEARIATVGWIGGILPMMGLLGTVSGMITTFRDLAETTSRQVLSLGLSEALWTTEVALLAALPLLAVHHVLSRLRESWVSKVERRLGLLWEAADIAPDAEDDSAEAAPQVATGGRAHEA